MRARHTARAGRAEKSTRKKYYNYFGKIKPKSRLPVTVAGLAKNSFSLELFRSESFILGNGDALPTVVRLVVLFGGGLCIAAGEFRRVGRTPQSPPEAPQKNNK